MLCQIFGSRDIDKIVQKKPAVHQQVSHQLQEMMGTEGDVLSTPVNLTPVRS
jgi:hypothetical protein